MATTLGDFTPEEPAAADEVSFGWFGAQIRIGAEFGDAVFADWAEEFTQVTDDDPRAGYVTKILWQRLIHPDDFAEFWRLAREHRQGTPQLARLFRSLEKALVEQETGRPTERPSGSTPGPSSESTSSTGTSFEPGSAVSAEAARLAEAAQRQVSRLESQGRPDLALVAVKAQEARTA